MNNEQQGEEFLIPALFPTALLSELKAHTQRERVQLANSPASAIKTIAGQQASAASQRLVQVQPLESMSPSSSGWPPAGACSPEEPEESRGKQRS